MLSSTKAASAAPAPAVSGKSAQQSIKLLESLFTTPEHKSAMPITPRPAKTDLKSDDNNRRAHDSKLLEVELDNSATISALKSLINEKIAEEKALREQLEALKIQASTLTVNDAINKNREQSLAVSSKLESVTSQIKELNALVTKIGANLFAIRENVSAHQREFLEKHSGQLEDLEHSLVSIREQNTKLLSRMNALTNTYNNLVTQNATMRDSLHRQTQANQNKTHWGWYALGAVAIVAGIALTATGIGAIAGVPLALATLGAMIGSAPLVAGFTTILLGLTAALTGIGSMVAGAFKIHKSRKNDQKSDKIFTAIADDLEALPIPQHITSSDAENLYALKASHKPKPTTLKTPAPATIAVVKKAGVDASAHGRALPSATATGLKKPGLFDAKSHVPTASAAASATTLTPKRIN
jgi:hypothetical protein